MVFPVCCHANLVSFQVNKIKQSVFSSSTFSTSILLLACLPPQHYFVTGNSMCASLPFDMEHQERFHCTVLLFRHTSVSEQHSKEGHCHTPAALLT